MGSETKRAPPSPAPRASATAVRPMTGLRASKGTAAALAPLFFVLFLWPSSASASKDEQAGDASSGSFLGYIALTVVVAVVFFVRRHYLSAQGASDDEEYDAETGTKTKIRHGNL